jgi:predicted dehydrogenase
MTYTASIVGAGMAGKLALQALTASKRFRPTAVADLSEDALERIRQKYPDLATYSSPQQMFQRSPSDVICIATYAPSHLPLTLEALQLPIRGLVVEKPLADTAAAGRKLLDAIKARQLPVAVPHGLLVSPHGSEIIRRVRNGEIGALRLVEIRNTGWDLLNAGIHWLNFFVALTGNDPVEWVMGAFDTSTRTYRDGMQVETLGVTYAVTRSGIRVVLNSGDELETGVEGRGCVFHIVGTRGTIEFWGWENAYRLLNPEHPDGRLIVAESDGRGNHQRHFEALAEQIDGEAPDYALADSSLIALEIVEGSYLSHRHRCVVRPPLTGFVPPRQSEWDLGRPYSGSGGGRDGKQ